VENLLGQIADDVVGNLRSLSLDHKPNELSHGFGHVVLVVEEVNNFLDVVALHVANVLAVLVHTNLEDVEQRLLKVGHFCKLLMVFQQVETCLDQTLYEVFVDLLI